jgi:hypothetical protein
MKWAWETSPVLPGEAPAANFTPGAGKGEGIEAVVKLHLEKLIWVVLSHPDLA